MNDRLLELARDILGERDLDLLLERALDGLIELCRAERGMILLFGDDGDVIFEQARRLRRQDIDRPDLEVSRTVIERVRRSGLGFYSANALDDPNLAQRASVMRLMLLSVVCQPILAGDRVLGVVYLDDRRVDHRFDPAEAALAERFSAFIAAAAHQAFERRRLESRIDELHAELARKESGLLGEHPAMLALMAQIDKLAPVDVTVLIRGESGSGKELAARALHQGSRRRARPFVAVNCGALPENLLEAELFGVEKGAYTGAVRSRPGFLARAEGGTLFLDEVAELTPALQVKLLRVLETGDYSPLGSDSTRRADVRVLAATHRDLEALVASGALRQDFLFRLDVVSLLLPPLRARRSDLPLLCAHLLDALARKHGHSRKTLSAAAVAALAAHDFPGNVRELRNALERGLLLAEGEQIEPRHLPAAIGAAAPAAALPSPPPEPEPSEPFAAAARLPFRDAKALAVETFERTYLGDCLARAGGNISEAARLADMPYKNFHAKLQQLGLDPLAYKRRA